MKIFFLCSGIFYAIGAYTPANSTPEVTVQYKKFDFRSNVKQDNNIFQTMPTKWIKQ